MNLIEKIKMLFKAEEDKTFIEAKGLNNDIFRFQELQEGNKISQITEEGELNVEPGSYVLEGNIEVVVDEKSIISEVKEFSQESEEETVENVEETEENNEETEEFSEETTEETEEFSEESEEETEEFTSIALKDGPMAYVISALSGQINVNDKLMISGVEAAPNTYNTTDGRVLMVGEGGVIFEIKDKVEEEEDPMTKLTQKIDELNTRLAALTMGFEKVEEENKELKKQIEEFSAAPSAKPTKTTVDFKKLDREEKIKFFGK